MHGCNMENFPAGSLGYRQKTWSIQKFPKVSKMGNKITTLPYLHFFWKRLVIVF